MSHRTELFEFLCTLIDIQIKKYVSLATFGVGPDARLNAKLVFNEVNELLEFADRLQTELQTNLKDNTEFIKIFNQVKFYIDQEYVRAYAGWLLSENNIHSTVKERVSEQLDKLKNTAQLINLDISAPLKPETETQKQCEHDSCAIAFRILELAQKIRSNPQMELDNKIPDHAKKVLRVNATTRYVNYADDIDRLHKKYDEFLQDSDLGKSSSTLLGEDAKNHQEKHLQRLDNLLKAYKNINAKSVLFSSEYEWYKVGSNEQSKSSAKSLLSNSNILFTSVVVVGGLLIYMLTRYFNQLADEQSLQSTLKLD